MAWEYRETRSRGRAAAAVACVWARRAPTGRRNLVVPDGCVDVIFRSGGGLMVAGADTGPRVVELAAGTRVSGVRLRLGAAGAVLGVDAAALRDHVVDVSDVWGERAVRLQDALTVAPPERRGDLLLRAVIARAADPDPLVVASVPRLARPGARVASVAADLGVSERHLHRRTVAAVGYGPKMLARVARLRRLLALQKDDLASRALAAGYASQAHMNHDVRRLTGLTPVRFLEDSPASAP